MSEKIVWLGQHCHSVLFFSAFHSGNDSVLDFCGDKSLGMNSHFPSMPPEMETLVYENNTVGEREDFDVIPKYFDITIGSLIRSHADSIFVT